MSILKSKHTAYNGHNFRSRTEARWAVFFDMMGIRYFYEYEDFKVGAKRYLPDFFLPDNFPDGCFAEVKHRFKADESALCAWLCEQTGLPVILLEDVPALEPVSIFVKEGGEVVDYRGAIGGAGRAGVWFEPPVYDETVFCEDFRFAVLAARRARFEFGETPKINA